MNRPLLEKALAALTDMHSGWKYIRETHGDLYGVGWDRAQQKAEESIAALRAALAEQDASVDGYAIKGPDGVIWGTTSITPDRCWYLFSWSNKYCKDYKSKGYTCVPVTISERKEQP